MSKVNMGTPKFLLRVCVFYTFKHKTKLAEATYRIFTAFVEDEISDDTA